MITEEYYGITISIAWKDEKMKPIIQIFIAILILIACFKLGEIKGRWDIAKQFEKHVEELTIKVKNATISEVNRNFARYGNIDNLSEIKQKDLEKYYGSQVKGGINALIKDFNNLRGIK